VIIKELKVNMMTHEVFIADDPIDLTAKEYALLEFFIHNVDRAINRISIAEHVWQYDFDTGTNFIDVYINRLRKKLRDTEEKKMIHTVRGYGYILKSN
jgi:DNA-binding response OmpR family regulator